MDNNTLVTASVLILTASLFLRRSNQEDNRRRRFWVRPTLRYREREGQAAVLLPRLRSRDVEWFRDYLRMPPRTFDTLLELVRDSITKEDTRFRNAIPASDRLALTIRFLAQGDSLRGTSFNFLVGRSTACKIITETCEALWNCLMQRYLSFPSKSEEWIEIAEHMEARWNFPNCLGSIDGKHVVIQCPPNSGSTYFSYKKTFSTVLLAVCDGRYRFTYIDIGHPGSESDGGIFARCPLNQVLQSGGFEIPTERLVGSAGQLPYFMVGDEAFPLRPYMMRPYPRRGGLQYRQKIFNYRLSRARRLIENTFGILAARWRILRRPFQASADNATRIVKACVVLHNFLLKESPIAERTYNPPGYVDEDSLEGNIIEGGWRRETQPLPSLSDTSGMGCNAVRLAASIREKLSSYFTADGSVPWQNNFV